MENKIPQHEQPGDENLKLKAELNKRDNIIKLLTGIIEVIKSDVNIKTQQLDYLINHMKNHNYDEFDYETCINSISKVPPLKEKVNSLIPSSLNEPFSNFNLKDHSLIKNKNIALSIFSYLNDKDLINVSMACKSLNEISRSQKLWKRIYFKSYNSLILFDSKDRYEIVPNAKEFTKTNQTILKDPNFFKSKYLELKRLNRNWEDDRPVVTTLSTTECVTCLNLDPSTNELIYSCVDGSASLFRLYSIRKLNDELCMQHHRQIRICDKLSSFYGHGGPIWCMDRFEDLLITGSYDKTIKLWRIRTGQCLNTMRAHRNWVSSLNFDPSYDMLVSGSWDSAIKLWNMKTLQNELTLESPDGTYIYTLKANLKDNEIIAGTAKRTVDLWDVSKQIKHNVLYGHLEGINNLKYKDNLIFTASEDKTARVWDKRTGRCEILLNGHTKGLTQIEFDSLNRRIFTSSIDKTIKLWDIRKNKEIRTLVGHSNSVYSIAYDQTKLISGSKDNSIRIWNFLN